MIRKSPEELQTAQDISRAEFLVALARGLSREESAEALKYRAATEGLSLHAAALAVLTTEPTDELLITRPSQPPAGRHLYALRSFAADEAAATSDGAALAAPHGRHHRR